jgi:heme-degrading monooxygenase HmoA
MVIERAELPIVPGKETDFEAAMVRGQALLADAPGCRSVSLARGVESPSTYLLLLQWDSVDAHVAFTKTPAFAEFGQLAGPFFAGKPAMAHFAPVR